MRENDEHRYDDMLELPHHVSAKHPRMSRRDRAAQFSPFKALAGYEDAVREAARQTEEQIKLDDDALSILNAKLQILRRKIKSRPEIALTYFVPDRKKNGGDYVTVTGNVRQIDEIEKTLLLTDGSAIPIRDIIDLEGEIFGDLERGDSDA